MNVGDVVWIEFPPGAGRAQAGRRPAIVAQTAGVSGALPMVLVIPLSAQQDALRFPGTVLIEPDAANGLRRLSVALVFQLTSIDKRFVGSQLGAVSQPVMSAIWEAFDELAGR
jgi:mRNA-degrading endonuclease toxin of MazEF toxin-antitoxin module